MKSIYNLPDNWESEMEYQALLDQRNRYLKRAYICSPCSDSSRKGMYQNMVAARFYMQYAKKELCFSTRAPHAYLPVLFNDGAPAERALALRIGLHLLELSDIVLVCGDRLSNGMRGEIEHAVKIQIPILVFHPDLYLDVRKLVTRVGGDKQLVSSDPMHHQLTMNAAALFELEADEKHA